MAENHSFPSPAPRVRLPVPIPPDPRHNGGFSSPSLAEEGQADPVAILNDSPASSRTIGNSPEPARTHTHAQAHMVDSALTPEAEPHYEVPCRGFCPPRPAFPPPLPYMYPPLPEASRPKSLSYPPPTLPQPMSRTTTWAGPIPVSNLSTTDFMPAYPPIGKLAMTRSGSEEVVAAGPDGLAYFRRVLDHPSKPWSQPRRFPPTEARLNASTVTGLATHKDMDETLRVYCVAEGKMHAFSCPEDFSIAGGFVVDSCPAFDEFEIEGNPAATTLSERIGGIHPDRTLRWCVVVPHGLGGFLYSETKAPRKGSYDMSEPPEQVWKDASLIAEHLGKVSAVSIAVTLVHKTPRLDDDPPTEIVAACIAGGHLHSIEGPFKPGEETWDDGALDIPIQHPSYVVGNPVLLSEENEEGQYQLDLLVPSAEGSIFHFMRTAKTPREWHMIGRVKFPRGFAIVSSLACARLGWLQLGDKSAPASSIHAIIQCHDGKIYFIKTSESATPWVGSQLHPILRPGPFPH